MQHSNNQPVHAVAIPQNQGTRPQNDCRWFMNCCGRWSGCAFLFMVIIGGVALVAVGARHASTQVDHHQRAEEYNNAVSNYGRHPAFRPAELNATAVQGQNVMQLHGTTSPVLAFSGTRFEIDEFESTLMSTQIHNWQAGQVLELFIQPTTSATSGPGGRTTRLPPLTKPLTAGITCSAESCYDDCSEEWRRQCDSTMLDRTCKRRFGANASYSGVEECEGSELCGICEYTGFLDTVCVVVDPAADNTAVSFDHTLHSCFYPFGPHDHKYTSGARVSSVTVQMRSQYDPYIVMQRVTEGSMSFGSFEDHYSKSILLVGLGAGMIIASLVTVCCYACCCRERRNSNRSRGEEHNSDFSTSSSATYNPSAPQQHTVVEMNPINATYPGYAPQQTRNPAVPQQETRQAPASARRNDPIEGVVFVGNYRDESDPHQVPGTPDEVVKPTHITFH